MLVGFYLTTFILAVLMTLVLCTRNKRLDTLYALFGFFVSVNCWGRYLLSVSKTIEVAILANKILYLGGVFAPLTLIFILVRLCEVKMPKWVNVLVYGFGICVYAAVLTIGHNTLYYKDVSLAYKAGYYYLIKDYGPLHILYPILMIICLLLLGIMISLAFLHSNSMPKKIVLNVAFLGIGTIICYILERALHSTIEWVSISYLIACGAMVYLSDRVNMFDISSNISNAIEIMDNYGYIVFDRKKRYIRSNEFAEYLFPEIIAWKTDMTIQPEDSLAYKEIVKMLEEWVESKTEKTIQVNDKWITMNIHNIYYHGQRRVGYLIEIADKTIEKKYVKTIENYNIDLEKDVSEKTKRILHMKDSLIMGMAIMVEGRDSSTGGHIQRTSDVVRIFAKHIAKYSEEYMLSEQFLSMVVKAMPMHDLGKITVDDKVLKKQGKFEPEEFECMKAHAAEGGKIVERVLADYDDAEFVEIAKNIANYHHEKWNGGRISIRAFRRRNSYRSKNCCICRCI